ncbi:MAG: sulfur carrier protein ThiS [Pseudomonadota bacterium]
MDLTVNGEPKQLADETTVAGLLLELSLAERRVAVECNGAIVPKSQHAQQVLKNGDRIEIVHAIGGG